MTKHAATPFPHIGPSNILELSTTADVSPHQANQNHFASFMKRKEMSPDLKEIRWRGYKPVKEGKGSHPPNPTAGFVPFMTVKVINPLAATRAGQRQAGGWWIFITLPATSRNLS